MHKFRYGNWVAPFGLLLRLLTVITAQPGFLSISCGGITNHTGENDITWVSDADYIGVGKTVDIGEYATEKAYGSYLQTLRFFPRPLRKSCYKLPVTPDVPYLVRLWFTVGNYTGSPTLPSSFQYSIETLGMLHVVNVTMSDRDPIYKQRILVSSGRVLYICFIRTSESDDPFISAIELRKFQDGMYGQTKTGKILLPDHYNLGGNSVVRYPQDKFDRIWRADALFMNVQIVGSLRNVSLQDAISNNSTKEFPPSAAMQTALVGNSLPVNVNLRGVPKLFMIFYFAELEKLNMSESRSFYVQINGEKWSDTITLVRNYSAIELTLPISDSQLIDSCNIVKATNSTRPPILNAFEYHGLYNTDQATYAQDLYALEAIKGNFDIKEWVSDPCYQIPWNGIVCDSRSSPIRISELYLSGRNLTGSVPTDIGHLTALVYISLDNNHLMGNLPNFSNLTMLERLHLQNNNLTGTVEWLSKLKNLQELYLQNNNLSGNVQWLSELKNLKILNIENNYFSGVIPAQLLLNCSLKLNYSGNHYLRILEKRKCTPQNSNNHNLKVVLGITLSGTLIIALGLTLGVVVYRNKFRRKGDGVATESSRVEKERKPFFKQDCSRIMVPNPSNCRAFTLNEITVATETFSREIGRGGFGSVFFGKLPEGKDIAVKVLSLFSHQGVQEFLNEVDLLSRINHRNLVSLLGYCNESREVMLIYEHMSGGSLRDHLYGPRAENFERNWKIRLNIALDAAQGLEYLHVGATSKIIHRDVKTANILLDGNLNGKLADFGLSRMTIDGQATHVTTTVKGTFGYLDPEYYNTQMLTEKSDIYSFGVVLLEIICGRPPIDPKLAEDGVNIIRWATPYILDMNENAGKVTEIIDKRLDGSYDLKSITSVAKVALRCVQALPSCRPSVSEVVAELREAMKNEDKASISISEEIGIESDDRVAASVYSSLESSEPKVMQWSDNSSNISKVGR